MSITRSMVRNARARIAAARASAPPLFFVLEREDRETLRAWNKRVLEGEKKVAAWQASGRRADLIAISAEADDRSPRGWAE